MFDGLPKDGIETMNWSWDRFEPYYLDLDLRTLAPDNVTRFLADWTRLSEVVSETAGRLHVAKTVNTADKNAEERFNKYLENVYPKVEEAGQKLREKLLEQKTAPEGFEIPLRKMRETVEIFREENIPLHVEDEKLSTEYDKISGAQTVEWEGKEVTLTQLRPIYQSPDRTLREKVWRLAAGRQLADKDAIGGLWRQFMDLRLQMAHNAGFDDFRSFRWKQFHRFDYTPDDCKAFHRAIEEVVTPAAQRSAEKRRSRLGTESLRPWDMDVDPLGRPPLAPFKEVAELQSRASAMFHSVDPNLGSYFDIMVAEGLLDLDNRKNKAPGGYCTSFEAVKRPFIFMNAVGVHDDVQTLMHEAGHAFHHFEAGRLPFIQQRSPGIEFCEVASMSMELIAAVYLNRDKGGFYSDEDARRARVDHLEWCLRFWPHMALVDAFQHWVYENPQLSREPANCDEEWARLSRRFITWIDWTGLEEHLRNGWQTKLHIHQVPFYYVEYGLAQLGAVQVWGNALENRAEAVAAYRRALALGNTVSLPDLFETAGARFAFDAATLEKTVKLIERNIEAESC